MTQDEIIEMARQAGMDYLKYISPEAFEKVAVFAKLVAQHEREACAQFIETGYVRQFENPWRDDLSAAIRARSGEQK
jgi:hypothetical protein